MKVNKKRIVESIVVSVFVYVISLGWNVLQGYLLTKNYVPDIVNRYATVDYLQSKVSFGVTYELNLLSLFVVLLNLMIIGAIYYLARSYITRVIEKRRSGK
ncbi:hypothetical protein MO973_04270 [Paenibacillus sp. TRM 82003]|nr:hypothetical protein [Paenibacillus sp. TRM 82003]